MMMLPEIVQVHYEIEGRYLAHARSLTHAPPFPLYVLQCLLLVI